MVDLLEWKTDSNLDIMRNYSYGGVHGKQIIVTTNCIITVLMYINF